MSSSPVTAWFLKVWLVISYIYSSILYLTCTAFVFYGIITGHSNFYDLPFYANLIIFFVLLFLLGSLEGVQISLITLMKQPPELYKKEYSMTWRSVKICKKPNNLERFLQGRQIVVTICAFLLSKLTTVQNTGVFPDAFEQGLLATGIFGAIMVTITAQLSPRLVALQHPVPFMNNIAEHVIFLLCMVVEFLGLGFCAWIIAAIIGFFAKLKVEENVETHELQEVIQDRPGDFNQLTLMESLDKEEMDFVSFLAPSELTQGSRLKHDSSSMNLMEYDQDAIVEKVKYPSPEQVGKLCERQNLPLPPFLLNPSDPGYIPPHVYACHIYSDNQSRLKTKLKGGSSQDGRRFSSFNVTELDHSLYIGVESMVELLFPHSLEKTV